MDGESWWFEGDQRADRGGGLEHWWCGQAEIKDWLELFGFISPVGFLISRLHGEQWGLHGDPTVVSMETPLVLPNVGSVSKR